jgi:RNA polymerase subunit RPABC4/transcription elongation factor Spt4
MIECPSCRAELEGNPDICPECGTSLDVNQEFFCADCEQSFFGKRNICPYCGSKKISPYPLFYEN